MLANVEYSLAIILKYKALIPSLERYCSMEIFNLIRGKRSLENLTVWAFGCG